MNNKDEFLYTDIALQLFTTFANADDNEPEDNKKILETLFNSISADYGDNPFFMPALIYAFMTHMNVIFTEIAAAQNANISDVRNVYTIHYNNYIRPLLSENMSNKPSKHKELMTLIELDDLFEEDN